MSAIDTICGELSKVDAALHRKPLPPARVQEALKRLSRVREHLLVVEASLRQACTHEGVQGACPACRQEVYATHDHR